MEAASRDAREPRICRPNRLYAPYAHVRPERLRIVSGLDGIIDAEVRLEVRPGSRAPVHLVRKSAHEPVEFRRGIPQTMKDSVFIGSARDRLSLSSANRRTDAEPCTRASGGVESGVEAVRL
jgi:hypothetical protein